MGVIRLDGVDDKLSWGAVTDPLSKVVKTGFTGFTVAALVKRAGTGTGDAISAVVNAAAFAIVDMTLLNTNVIGVISAKTASTFLNVANPYLFVISQAGTGQIPRLGWKLASGGAWTHENLDVGVAVGGVTDSVVIGTTPAGGNPLNGWIGVVAWWDKAMPDLQKEELGANWRTSDWWRNSLGPPIFLTELNTAAPVDLSGNAFSLVITGSPAVDSNETLNGWTFDGVGTPVGTVLAAYDWFDYDITNVPETVFDPEQPAPEPLVQAKSAADVNKTTTELGVIAFATSSPDVNGVVTESVLQTYAPSSSDANGTVTESASVTPDSTPISDTDANGALGEIDVLLALASVSDVNGSAEAPVLVTVESSTDANGATTEIIKLSQISADVNGTVTEVVLLTIPVAVSEANGAITEAISLAVTPTATDSGGVSAENTLEAVGMVAPDANGSVTEATSLRLAGSDASGAITEAQSILVPVAGTDASGTTVDAIVETAVFTQTEANAPVVESATPVMRVTDANGVVTEAQTISTPLSSTDANGTITENTILNKQTVDANAATTEAITLAANSIGSETGTEVEAATIKLGAADVNGAITEAASISVPIASSDANGALTETGGVRVFITAFDAATIAEAAQVVAKIISVESGTEITASQVKVVTASSDAGAETETQIFGQTITDAGSLAELESIVQRYVSNDQAVVLENFGVFMVAPENAGGDNLIRGAAVAQAVISGAIANAPPLDSPKIEKAVASGATVEASELKAVKSPAPATLTGAR